MHNHVTMTRKRQILDKRENQLKVTESDLNVVASLLHTDTLSILAGEVGGLAGTQLQVDTKQC